MVRRGERGPRTDVVPDCPRYGTPLLWQRVRVPDAREELILYDPWSPQIHIYTPHPLIPQAYRGYRPTPRQYNPRLMD